MRGLQPDGPGHAKAGGSENICEIAVYLLAFAGGGQQALVRPVAPRHVVVAEPRVAAIANGGGGADNDGAVGCDQPREQRTERVAVHPMQSAADGHDIEAADIFRQVLRPAFAEGHLSARPRGRSARGSQHPGFGVDSHDAASIGGKAACKQARSGAEIDQCVLPGQRQFLRGGSKEIGRVGRPVLFVEFGCGGEASHAPRVIDAPGRFHPAQIKSLRMSGDQELRSLRRAVRR